MEAGNKFNDNTTKKNERKSTVEFGRILAAAKPGEEIVISGISGAFPSSDNIHEFRDNLYNKVNMVQPNRRWDLVHPEIPPCSGTIPEIGQYDPGFFGIHRRQVDSLDVQLALLYEKVIEAIFDAGMHPSDLQNTRTGVYCGICYTENEKKWFFEILDSQNYCFTGSQKSMIPHRLSYLLKLKGPSHTTDTACSSSLYALEHAFRAFRLGEIESAIVAGTNLCLHPSLTLQSARLGTLSKDGCCKPFDEKANGYARSEAIGVLILQKAMDAKRVYAEVVYAKTNCDGFKEDGITFPSRKAQSDLLNDFYDECEIDRSSLSFLEAHTTGTIIGDPEECSAIDQVFRRNRKKPLLVGSVKSNIGHSESASGVCSIIKCIIGMETGFIPPNIFYNTPRSSIKALIEGRMRVVTEKTAFEDDRVLIGVNSFGFGGANCHVLLQGNPKTKPNVTDNLPRLVCLSGRTQQAVVSILDSVTKSKFDPQYVKLLHEGFRKNVENHLYRGYTIRTPSEEVARSITFLKYFPSNAPPVCFVFGELKNWYKIGSDLMTISAFSTFIKRAQNILSKHKVVLFDDAHKEICNMSTNLVLCNVVVQMGLINLFNLVEIKASSKFGYSIGKLLCAYYEGTLSFEETINYAFAIGKALNDLRKTIDNDIYQILNCDSNSNGPNLELGNDTRSDSSGTSFKTADLIALKGELLQTVLKNIGHVKDNNTVKSIVDALFNNKILNIPPTPNSIVVKIGDSLLNTPENWSIISLFNGKSNSFVELLKGLGSLYESGFNPQISKLYPSVEFPVGRGTEMISPYIKWNHRTPKYVPLFNVEVNSQVKHESKTILIHTEESDWAYITGHIIDSRNIFPATGYLCLVWETLAAMKGMMKDVMHVCFENCRFIRTTTIPKKGYLTLQVNVNRGTGYFEVIEGNSLVVTGKISILDNNKRSTLQYKPVYSVESGDMKLKNRDIYKELRLRGYQYKGEFRAIEETDRANGLIRWNGNWVTFMDNMLQLVIMLNLNDTRLLYVPTTISKLTINGDVQMGLVAAEKLKGEKDPLLPVTLNSLTNTISCGGIKLEGLIANSIPRKRVTTEPVLETYKFIPNDTKLSLEHSVRVNMQIVLENYFTVKVKGVELIDEFTDDPVHPLSPIIKLVIEDHPLVQPFLKILAKKPLDVGIDVENKKLESESDCLIVIASKLLNRPDKLEEALSILTDDGFILTREPRHFNIPKKLGNNFSIFTIHRTTNETLLLLKKVTKTKQSEYIRIHDTENFSWLPELQNAICKEKNEDVVLYAEDEPKNGIIGLVNCLRREPQTKHVRCVFAMDKMETFKPRGPFYDVQLKKQMAMNIYKDGQWGTYRHLPLEKQKVAEKEHCFLKVITRGDLSSLRWVEGPLRHDMKPQPGKKLIHIYYGALNFRDILTTGKINADAITKDRLDQEFIQGCEFSGRDKEGNRYMGMKVFGGHSTMILADTSLLFPIPNNWSLEEAATIPVVYGTVIYGLIMRAEIKKGESILIHSGTGGVGQAAIRVALGYGCKVFTTVGSPEKREFLMKIFPQLEETNIGNSRDESFEQLVYAKTNGRGVDLVLNSLSDEKLITSVRCLARGGRFLEIGKFDAINNHSLNALLLQKDASFHGVMLDKFLVLTPQHHKMLFDLMINFIKQGLVKPLNRTIFKYDEAEQAYRFMANGKHKGKVLIQIREPEPQPIVPHIVRMFPCVPRFCCDPDKVYIILGGLGGFGLELADCLILRGAKKLILASRKGATTGYQNYRLRLAAVVINLMPTFSTWKNYDIVVKVSTTPIITREGCKQLIEEALELGPIDGIFNLAVVLADAIFENQTIENFSTSFKPKAYATEYLDQLTRKMCPDLSTFVVFSSVSCGRGNAGQTNYGMSNSVMERICEDRKKNGYPALAIEWGAIGEVGLVAEMLEEDTKIEIGGTLQQRIINCLEVMDVFLGQNEASLVSSMVVAEKHALNSGENVIDAVMNLLGATDSNSLSFHATLTELGMDSITAVEIKQMLETEFNMFLSTTEMRTLTLAKLRDIQNNNSVEITPNAKNLPNFGMETIFKLIGNKKLSSLPFLELTSKVPSDANAPTLVMLGGIEGAASVFQDFAKHISAHVIGVQLNLNGEENTIPDMALTLLPVIEKYSPNRQFTLLAYSYGTVIALEVVSILESRGYVGTLICVDGSPLLLKQMTNNLINQIEPEFETDLLCSIMSFSITAKQIGQHKESILKCDTWTQRLDLAADIIKQYTKKEPDYEKLVTNNIYKRIKALHAFSPAYSKLKAKGVLLKAREAMVMDVPEDYGLSEYLEKPVDISTIDGNHSTILDNVATAEKVNSYL